MNDIKDLKSECYDILVQIQQLQQLLAEKNQQIAQVQEELKKK